LNLLPQVEEEDEEYEKEEEEEEDTRRPHTTMQLPSPACNS